MELDARYDECSRMLEGLHPSLSEWKCTTRTGKIVVEDRAAYGPKPVEPFWSEAMSIAEAVEEKFSWNT